jgi:hypothetical protein
MDCGRKYPIKDLIEELDEKTLERIAMFRCDRV